MNFKRISDALRRISKQDLLCILILLSATVLSRLLLMWATPFMYGQDAYLYVGEARKFAYNGVIDLEIGMPFILTLGVFLRIFGPIFGDINVSRFFMVFLSAVLVIIIYLFGVKMKSRLFGLLAALLAVFEPFFLEWSTVPYREIFAVSAGLLSLYFAISDRRLFRILSPVFFYLSVATRPELFLPLVVPIVIIYLNRILKLRSEQGMKTKSLAPFTLAIIIYALPFVGIYSYVQSWGTFGIVQRLALFLTPGLLSTTMDLTFEFYDTLLWDRLIYLFVGLVLALVFLTSIVRFERGKEQKRFSISTYFSGAKGIKGALLSEKGIIASCLFLVFVIYVLVMTVFAYGYNWAFSVSPSDLYNVDVLRSAVVIIPRLPVRYLILLRLLIGFPLVYPLALAGQKVWSVVHREK